MNFFKYIQTDAAAFWENYLEAGWVQVQHHQEFPLDIYNYTRAAVHENKWDAVTSKCRGIIVNRDTGEIVARPFEKFHNYGSEFYVAARRRRPTPRRLRLLTPRPSCGKKWTGSCVRCTDGRTKTTSHPRDRSTAYTLSGRQHRFGRSLVTDCPSF